MVLCFQEHLNLKKNILNVLFNIDVKIYRRSILCKYVLYICGWFKYFVGILYMYIYECI